MPVEPSLKIFPQQAQRLYEQGVAAAKGGQRVLAAGLLRKALRLNPRHEQAWLWLSGVLDEPEEQAFCLRAVLELNPHHERARQGLTHLAAAHTDQSYRWRRQRRAVNPLLALAPEDPWWRKWRTAQSVRRQTLLLVWLLPLVLIVATAILRSVIYAQPLPTITYRDLPAPVVAVVPSPSPAITEEPVNALVARSEQDRLLITSYFDDVRVAQQRLQSATEAYREATKQSRTTVERAAAAQGLRNELAQQRDTLLSLSPPADLKEAHTTYLDGLQLEQQALDKLMQFYTTREVALANGAALDLQEARAKIDTGKKAWDSFAQQFNTSNE